MLLKFLFNRVVILLNFTVLHSEEISQYRAQHFPCAEMINTMNYARHRDIFEFQALWARRSASSAATTPGAGRDAGREDYKTASCSCVSKICG